MQPPRYVSTAAVSRALGVSVTTVKRWVDEGRLPAHRTAGGHRKILLDDVLRLVRQENWPHVNLAGLTGAGGAGSPATGPLSQQLYEALLRGEVQASREVLLGAYHAGLGSGCLADEVIAPAMARVGHGWEEGRVEVYQEHRATQVCLEALLDIKARLQAHPGRDRPVALGGGPEGDPYLLANSLAQMVLREQGWEVINLGPNTPLPSFRKAVADLRPRLLWLSCGYLVDPEAFLAGYRALYDEAERAGTAVAVGGRALTESVRSRMPYTTFGDGLSHLAAFARTLHPLRPPRGRHDAPPGEAGR